MSELGNVQASNVVILELSHSQITHIQKRTALRHGTFHKVNEIQLNFMEVLCDNTGTWISYELKCSHCERAALSLSSMFLQSFWNRLLNYNPNSGGRMQETSLQGKFTLQFLSRADSVQ